MAPEAVFHISVGAISMLSGVTALFSRKGDRVHRVAGGVFFISMLSTATSGVYMALSQSQPNNATAGMITIYLLITALATVRRKEGKTGLFELGAFLFAAAGGAAAFYFAIDAMQSGTAMLGGIPYLIFASIIALAALLDLSVILRRGISGKQRIARHLWRMHLGFAAAVGSFFPGQVEIFPQWIREIEPFIVLFTPPFAVLGLMFFWLAVVLFTNWFNTAAVATRTAPRFPPARA